MSSLAKFRGRPSSSAILRLEGVFVAAEKYFPNSVRFLEVSQCVAEIVVLGGGL